MNEVCQKDNCTGCGLCEAVCPQKAIKLTMAADGFFYPVVDNDSCVDCKLCSSTCGNSCVPACESELFFAAKNKDAAVQMDSSSGGVFYSVARYIILQGGVVFGAAFNWEKNTVEHIRVSDMETVKMLMGSKYVQSVNVPYELIAEELTNGKSVLFVGTPCQVDACKKYLSVKRIRTDRFYSCDFVCHGVPSPKLWEEYIKGLRQKYGNDISDYRFRYKSERCDWGTVNVSAVINKKRITNTRYLKSYIRLYFDGLITRRSCEKCKYTSLKRCSDITLADCWGIEKAQSEAYDKKGVSLVIVNNEKGKVLFDAIRDSILCCPVDITKLDQPHLHKPFDPAEDREKVWNAYTSGQYCYDDIAKKYTEFGTKEFIKRKMLRLRFLLIVKVKALLHL